MPIYRITFEADLPDQTQHITLNERKFRLHTWWNSRTNRWMLDVFTEEGDAVLLGDALVNGAFPGANNLDFPVTLSVYAPEVQRIEDLWEGRIRLYYYT